MTSRLESLRKMLENDPADSFTKYAIGLEYFSLKEFDNARDVFEELKNSDPGYHATYYQLGKVYEHTGDEQMAKKVYEQGIFVTTQQSEFHAKAELEQALNDLLI